MFVWQNFTMRIFECTGDKQYTEVFAVDQFTASEGIDYGALDAVRVADVNHDGVNEMYIAATEPQNKVFIITGVTDVSKMTTANIKELYTIPVTAGGKVAFDVHRRPRPRWKRRPYDRRRTQRPDILP